MIIIRKTCIHNVKGPDDCMQRMVNEFLHVGQPVSMRDMFLVPKTDIYETDNSLAIFLELPGVTENDIQITFDSDHCVLLVYGRRKKNLQTIRKRVIQKEMVSGPFEKVLKINASVDCDNIKAKMSNGILEIAFPKL